MTFIPKEGWDLCLLCGIVYHIDRGHLCAASASGNRVAPDRDFGRSREEDEAPAVRKVNEMFRGILDALGRKSYPVATGVLAYFPDAILAVAEVSRIGNEQHNPGEPLHWAKEKSTDEPDALARHLIDWLRGDRRDPDGARIAGKIAWRALALLQRELDSEKKA